MDKILDDILASVVPMAKNLILAILVFVVGFKIVNSIIKRLKKRKRLMDGDPSAGTFILSFISIALKVIVIVSAIAILGVPMSSVVALIASAGVAVGLAVQGALSNLVGGMMILLFRPFKVGDYIDAEGASGTVREISVFYTTVTTPDNKYVTIPNGGLTNSVITNYSTEEFRRVDVEFTVDYKNDSELVKKTLLDVASKCTEVLYDPEPMAVITDCGENGITYVIRVWCKNEHFWDVKFALIEGTRKAFKEFDIIIPHQQMDVNIKRD